MTQLYNQHHEAVFHQLTDNSVVTHSVIVIIRQLPLLHQATS
jgi:hypothetical protein